MISQLAYFLPNSGIDLIGRLAAQHRLGSLAESEQYTLAVGCLSDGLVQVGCHLVESCSQVADLILRIYCHPVIQLPPAQAGYASLQVQDRLGKRTRQTNSQPYSYNQCQSRNQGNRLTKNLTGSGSFGLAHFSKQTDSPLWQPAIHADDGNATIVIAEQLAAAAFQTTPGRIAATPQPEHRCIRNKARLGDIQAGGVEQVDIITLVHTAAASDDSVQCLHVQPGSQHAQQIPIEIEKRGSGSDGRGLQCDRVIRLRHVGFCFPVDEERLVFFEFSFFVGMGGSEYLSGICINKH